MINEHHRQSWPFRQGEEIASATRAALGVGRELAIDVFTIVRDLGIDIHCEDLELPTLDALAVWGPRHGPAVLLNSGSQRHQGQGAIEERGAVRVTLAHELCHFLIDGEHALGAVDVLQSRMPVAIEQRARAFAAEFLVPTNLAAQIWAEADRPRDRFGLDRVLDQLCDRFKVSKSVASWKLEHGARLYGEQLRQVLATIVPQR
ncbi:ImmA/IrrE family metallo-endopeptidase [Ensifer sp. MPMI2T]|nr:ImmA/IrrE family metallo-endopeptidase [Ensifer sp. MPMI2T]